MKQPAVPNPSIYPLALNSEARGVSKKGEKDKTYRHARITMVDSLGRAQYRRLEEQRVILAVPQGMGGFPSRLH